MVCIKPPTLGTFSPPEITCGAPDGHPILVLQKVHNSLWMRCACCQCLYVTCNINVVSLNLVCNKHLLYMICYSLEEKRHFPSRIISKNRKKILLFRDKNTRVWNCVSRILSTLMSFRFRKGLFTHFFNKAINIFFPKIYQYWVVS